MLIIFSIVAATLCVCTGLYLLGRAHGIRLERSRGGTVAELARVIDGARVLAQRSEPLEIVEQQVSYDRYGLRVRVTLAAGGGYE